MMHTHVEGRFHQLTDIDPLATDQSGNTYTKICINPISKRDIYCLFSHGVTENNIDPNLMIVHVDP